MAANRLEKIRYVVALDRLHFFLFDARQGAGFAGIKADICWKASKAFCSGVFSSNFTCSAK